MKSLQAAEILQIWETGRGKSLPEQALLILAAAGPESPDELKRLTVGRCNARLLELRQATLGASADCRVACPACGESLEFALDLPPLLEALSGPGKDELYFEDYHLAFRMPASLDLAAVASIPDLAEARLFLLESCVSRAACAGEEIAPARLPERVIQALGAAILDNDPLTDPRLELECAACGYQWNSPLDVPRFFWRELEAQAHRFLNEVHLLARAYGWREGDILALSPARRQVYLEMVS